VIRHRARALATALLALLLSSVEVSHIASAGTKGTPPDGQQPLPGAVPGGALDTDCSHVEDGLGGPGYQFVNACPGHSQSPDGRFAIVQRGGESGGSVMLSDKSGELRDEIPSLMDAMPFVLFWQPQSAWFFVNHYLGSGLERLRVFEIVNRSAIERSSVFAEATREMVRRYPCLGRHASVVASGWQWSRDGRRIAMVVYARPDACLEPDGKGNWVPQGDWQPRWMIGDAATGRIDPASVRVRRNGVGPMPADGPYAAL
jgi:hypothetical protein